MSGYLGIEVCDEKPFIFFSYNTEDQKRLSNIALELQKHQMNIWYDKGIKRISEEEWQEQIALHIRDAEIVFFFISHGVFSKENSYVRKEYDVAKFWKKKICVVLLDKVEDSIIPAKYVFWWNEVLNKQCIEAVGLKDKETAEEIYIECYKSGAVRITDQNQDQIYCFKNSSILKNKLNIIDEMELSVAIDEIVQPIARELIEMPFKGVYNYDYLRKIHKRLYGQIFEWAGHTRTVNISDQLQYCYCNYIIPQTEKLFKELKEEKYLQNCQGNQRYSRLAYYLGELNAIHPFRYGNQVAQEVFVSIVAKKVGCNLNFDAAGRNDLVNGYICAYNGDFKLLEQVLKKIDDH